ncbi:MAG: hypothetical protein CVT49_06985 [candidate division Zixibacteria bacterium HGW-Zixibacteria-1]|nr:MAG: hypothetical protein CVT49_06985 [candidate division Zixibacteria bacterium HGW-Zixibacteria-1]
MKIFTTCLLILFMFSLHPVARETLTPLQKGKLLINIKYNEIISGPEYNTENLDQSLRNHLDFYLWSRGWDFEFVPKDAAGKIDSVIKAGAVSGAQYLLNIDVTPTFKTAKVRTNSDTGNKKIKYGGFLELELAVSLKNLTSGQMWPESRNVTCESRKEWVRDGDGFLSSDQTLPEPPDYVIMRALSEALEFLPVSEPVILYSKQDIPLYMILNTAAADQWDNKDVSDVRLALAYASRSLQRQFGIGLRPVGFGRLMDDSVSFEGIQRFFNLLLKTEPKRPDTFTIAVFDPVHPEDFFKRVQPSRIGLSDLGRHFSLVSRLQPPNEDVAKWISCMNGQLLLHEIGHLMGAIHVSDLHSIMNPVTAWVASDQFDILNRRIIEARRPAGFSNGNVKDYLKLIADALDNSGYGLADYPAVYFSYININRFMLQRDTFGEDGVGQSIPYAVAGMQMYLIKNLESARDNFYKALVRDTSQASIQYYLSKVTSGKLSELHLKKAAEMGYYRAINELSRAGQPIMLD